MGSLTWKIARSRLIMLAVVLSLALVPQLLRATPAMAAPSAQSAPLYLSTCGVISGYTAAMSSANGTITVGTQTFTIVAGTTFTGPAAGSVANGANLCFQFTLNSTGQVTAGVVSTPVYLPGTMQICGVVTAFTAAGASSAGSITIAGQTFTIVAGTVGTGMAIATGTSYCVVFTINPAGQIVSYSVGSNLPGVSIVCGIVSNFIPAAGVAQAVIVVNGVAFRVSVSVSIRVFVARSQVACFLLSPSGTIIGFLSGVPTLAVPVEATDSAQRVGRLLAR